MFNNNYFFDLNREFISKDGMVSNKLSELMSKKVLSVESLYAYLKLGYVPGDQTLFNDVKLLSNNDFVLDDYFNELDNFDHSNNELKNIMHDSINHDFDCRFDNIVPLSGGMDSRIILAALGEFTEYSNIHTYTFGTKGSYDYEIPNSIAKKLGTKHTNFSSENTIYSIDSLIKAAKVTDCNAEVFHPVVLNRVAEQYGDSGCYWSGFAGDAVGGAFGSKLNGEDPKQVLIDYESRGIHFLTDVVDDSYLYPYISNGEKYGNYISKIEACFWENHIERYTATHLYRSDMNIKSPFINLALLKFFFTLPSDERQNKKFFNESFSSIFPEIFHFPTTDYGYKYSKNQYKQLLHKSKFMFNASMWRLMPRLFTHPNTAYIDMRNGINDRVDIRNCIDELLSLLAKRNIIDNKRMYEFLHKHRSNQFNYTKDIINLASLEVFLLANDM